MKKSSNTTELFPFFEIRKANRPKQNILLFIFSPLKVQFSSSESESEILRLVSVVPLGTFPQNGGVLCVMMLNSKDF